MLVIKNMAASTAYVPHDDESSITLAAIMSANPEFIMPLLMAKAEATAMSMSQLTNLVYLRAGNSFVHAIMTITMAAKKNMSSVPLLRAGKKWSICRRHSRPVWRPLS